MQFLNTYLKALTLLECEAGQIDRAGALRRINDLDAGRGADIALPEDARPTLFQMRNRAHLLDLVEAMYLLRGALMECAEAHGETPLSLQTADTTTRPVTLGHWALMADWALSRDAERAMALYDMRMNKSPAGASFATGSPLNRVRMAVLLGFDGLMENAADALFALDLMMEAATVLHALGNTLTRLSEDLAGIPETGAAWREAIAPLKQGLLCRGIKARALACLTEASLGHTGPTGQAALPPDRTAAQLDELIEAECAALMTFAKVIDAARELDLAIPGAPSLEHVEQMCTQGAPGAHAGSLMTCRSRLRLGKARMEKRRAALFQATALLDREIARLSMQSDDSQT